MNANDVRDIRASIQNLVKEQAETHVLVRTLADAFKQERDGSAVYRKEVRVALGEIEGRLSVQENLSRVIEHKLSDIAPTVEEYRTTRDEARGAAKLAKAAAKVTGILWSIGSAIVAAIATSAGWLWWWLNHHPK